MAKNAFWANVLTGGGAAALDLIPGVKLQDLDFACVVTAGTLYPMVMDIDDGGLESSPDKIAPDTDAGTKMWELLAIRAAGITVPNTGLHILDTDASHDLIIKPGSNLTADKTFTITTGNADRTLDLAENLTLADGYNVILQALGQANSLILNESLTIGDGNDGTLTFKQASKALNVEDTNLIPRTGWPTAPGVTLSFSDGDRTFTVTDGGSAFYYILGVKYILGENKTVIVDNTEGLWYIYFDGATLTASQTIWSFTAEDKALVAYLYWDATLDNERSIFLGYELHTFHMDGSTHARLHYAGGTRWETGLLVTDAGSETVNVAVGDIWDEDLDIAITDGAGSALFEQVLSPAELPIYYLDGASNWRIYETVEGEKANATDVGYVSGGDLKWNDATTTWSNETVGNNNYVAYYVVATNEQTEPVALIMGQRVDNKLSDAKENNTFSGLTLTNLPFEEMVVLARLILNGSTPYVLEEVLDLRVYNIKGNITSPLIPDHGGLAGLGDDDHVQYLLKSTWDAYSILAADIDDTPAAVTLAVSEMIGRKATGGIVALTKTDILTILNVADGANVTGDNAPKAHNLIDTTGHPVSGLTPGHFLKATGAAAYAFAVHGLTYSDVGAEQSGVSVLETDYGADTFMYAPANNTPVATSPANVMAALSGHAGAAFAMNSHKFTGLSVPANAGDSIRATAKITEAALETAIDGEWGAAEHTLIGDAAPHHAKYTDAEVKTAIGGIDSGSWTPVLTFGNLSVGITYATQAGSYYRISSLFFASFDIILTSKGSSTGSARITGLPITNGPGSAIAFMVYFSNLGVNGLTTMCRVNGNTASIQLGYHTNTFVTLNDTHFANNTRFLMSTIYPTV